MGSWNHPFSYYFYFLSYQVTRYQNWAGQATAYMVGRLGILQARENASRSLGKKFNLKDFHYQVKYRLKRKSCTKELLQKGSNSLKIQSTFIDDGVHNDPLHRASIFSGDFDLVSREGLSFWSCDWLFSTAMVIVM